eukprot:GHVL01043753.1.p1 GENE.GHVL01043753.1~~GHVL01043753.1.p1  ORF type:complete len:541 (+),score=169.92 GHVL01043753.1:599-2221(+)
MPRKKIKIEKEEDESENSSSSSEDDDGAVLLTDKAEMKFFDVLTKIKQKDPSVYDEKETFWCDEDFESEMSDKEKAKKKLSYRNLVTQSFLQGDENLVSEVKIKRTPIEEQEEVKKAFIDAADIDDDTDLLEEVPETPESNNQNLKIKVLDRYFGPDETLNNDEKFLRDYILQRGWQLGGTEMKHGNADEQMDDLDEMDLERSDQHEKKYNFRFEEEGGTKIEGHSRNCETSVRRKDNSRREKRLKRLEKKKEEKVHKMEELKRLKNIKKKEIEEKLKKIEELTGVGWEDDQELENENMETYENDENISDDYEWWQCDNCLQAVPGGEIRYDCLTCDNFTLCSTCAQNIEHEHQMKKFLTADHSNPPENIKKDSLNSKLMDEYFALDYEDIIGTDLPTRFKYCSVKPNSYGLTPQELLEWDDKRLNQFQGIKKLAPFKDETVHETAAEKRRRRKLLAKWRQDDKIALKNQDETVVSKKITDKSKSVTDTSKSVTDTSKFDNKKQSKNTLLSESRYNAYGLTKGKIKKLIRLKSVNMTKKK